MFYDTDRCAEFTLPPKRGLIQKWVVEVFRFAAVKKKTFAKIWIQLSKWRNTVLHIRSPLTTLKKTTSQGVKYNATWYKEKTLFKKFESC